MRKLATLLFFVLPAFVVAGGASATPSQWSGNGHYYEVITSGEISWKAAYDAATASSYLGNPGYLATVTSAGEQSFVAGLLSGGFQYWIGGYQFPTVAAHDIGWAWDTNEPWSYTNWATNQPDDNGTCGGWESFLTINVAYGMGWNDEDDPGCQCHGGITGYVVEYGEVTGFLGQPLGGCNPPPPDCPGCPDLTNLGVAVLTLCLCLGGALFLARRRAGTLR
jgi:hypothetical protein